MAKRSNDHTELDIIKNRDTMNKNILMNRNKQCKLLSTTKKNEFNPLACQITRQLLEQCSDETQLRLQNKLSQVAEGSRFIEQQLRNTERENDVSLNQVLVRAKLLVFYHNCFIKKFIHSIRNLDNLSTLHVTYPNLTTNANISPFESKCLQRP